MLLFGSTVLIPEFLQTSLGYTAERAGMALSPGGLVLIFMMPIAGRLTASKIDPRLLVSIGFLGTAATLHLMTIIYLQIDFQTIVILRMIQVIFMPFIFIPISTLNYIGVPREKNNQVSGLSNFARNIGGSIGTSLLSTFLTRQNQTHLRMFASHTNHAATAAEKALALAYQTVQQQASALSFVNSFWVMSVVVACLTPLPFLMRRPRPGEQQPRAAH
jgi:DHA2 family multidrug resistance protein